MAKKLYRIEERESGTVYAVTYDRLITYLDAAGIAPLAVIESLIRGETVETPDARLYNPEMQAIYGKATREGHRP